MEKQIDPKTVEAEEHKTKGNEAFKISKYDLASEEYSAAINCGITSPKHLAVYYANRAFCNIKMENYGFAISDGDAAIKSDPTYPKGYYRRGSAYFALAKHENALSNFKRVTELAPTDADAQDKYKLVRNIIREKRFADSISVESALEQVNINSFNEMIVPSTYTGPTLTDADNVTAEWVISMMDWMSDQKILYKKYCWMLLLKAKEILKALPTLVDVEVPKGKEITVCGDTHGQFFDLLNIFKTNGNPTKENPYLFNGDFVDRGSFSVEVIMTLLTWKVHDPSCMHLTRGNHEAKSLNKLYGFEGEVIHKYDPKTMDLFSEVFNCLPLCYVLNSKVMIVHGGLFSKDGVKLEDIKKINRFSEPPEEGIFTEILWSDPHKEKGRHPSKRGVGVQFGPDVAHAFLNDNKLEILVRSHEMKPNGYEVEADGRVITIFSAPNYCDQMGNKGAFIKFNGSDMKPKFTTFNAVEHPKVPVMAYARNYSPWI
jgi:serine/threonine-protein phosphatase 5